MEGEREEAGGLFPECGHEQVWAMRTLGRRVEEKAEAQPESPRRGRVQTWCWAQMEAESAGGNVMGVVVQDKASTHVQGQCRWITSIAHRAHK